MSLVAHFLLTLGSIFILLLVIAALIPTIKEQRSDKEKTD